MRRAAAHPALPWSAQVPVLLTSGELVATLAAVRALRRAGYAPWVVAPHAGAYAARSRARAGVIVAPDPRRDASGYVEVLARACRRVGVRALLPMAEDALIALAGREHAFPEVVAVGSVPERMLMWSTDKVALGALARDAGLATPPTALLAAGDLDRRRADLDFPAVVKALRSELPAGHGPLRRWGAQLVRDREELRVALARLPAARGLVQPKLPGRLSAVAGIAWKGEMLCAVHFAAERLWPPVIGAMSAAHTIVPDHDLEQGVARLLAALGWSGVYQVQFIDTKTRRYLIDLNPRAFASLAIAVKAGPNLPAIWAGCLLGRSEPISGYRVGVRFRAEWNDLQSIGHGLARGDYQASLAGLLPRRHTAHAVFALNDLPPLISLTREISGRVRHRIGRLRAAPR